MFVRGIFEGKVMVNFLIRTLTGWRTKSQWTKLRLEFFLWPKEPENIAHQKKKEEPDEYIESFNGMWF